MRVRFNNTEYRHGGHNNTGLGYLCFKIFQYYLEQNNNLDYSTIRNIFNELHCTNNFIVLSYDDWINKPENTKDRYFEPINYNNLYLYFSTQWGNNGGDCDNILNIINFGKEQGYDIEIIENTLNQNEENNQNRISYSDNKIKNIILYGSPGVGKTHNTNKLIRLIEDGKSDREIFESIKANENSDSVDISDIKDRVKFVTFHQSFGYEDFIEGFRPNEEGNIELVDGVFKNICTIAQKNLDDSVKEKGLDIESLLNDFTRYIEEQEDFEIDENITIKVKKKSNGELQSFVTKGRVKNQNLTRDIIIRDLQDYIDGEITDYKDIKPTYESKSSYHGNAPYYYKLYAKIEDFSNKEAYQIEKVEQKNYYLVIDEINRGNISKIFGELITLLEEDKRDKLEVTLPYSKKPFKISSNLYIIGTMNSTDKSIALIDIALRRRFTFLKMKPNADLIEHLEAQRIFIALNQKITKDLGEDYQIGHSYFMRIENDNDLDFVLEYKIIPLLEEYYYGNKENSLTSVSFLKNLPNPF